MTLMMAGWTVLYRYTFLNCLLRLKLSNLQPRNCLHLHYIYFYLSYSLTTSFHVWYNDITYQKLDQDKTFVCNVSFHFLRRHRSCFLFYFFFRSYLYASFDIFLFFLFLLEVQYLFFYVGSKSDIDIKHVTV
jgi:hypothetical protein